MSNKLTPVDNFQTKNKYNQQNDKRVTLPARVAQWYYKHGLFLSSYPVCAFSIAVIISAFCCFPLANIPLPGTIPTKVVLPYTVTNNQHIDDKLTNFFNINNLTFEPPFPWARAEPYIYVQQIVLRTSVAPWNDDLLMTDAFRGPLFEVFKLIEYIRNHEYENNDKNTVSLGNICLHVENVKRVTKDIIFPEYNCLILSPANLWQQNSQIFNKDTSLLNTIFLYHNLQKTKVSTAEMLFGMPLRETGIKRYPIRVRPRIIQYAITLILRENHHGYIQSLKDKLTTIYNLHQTVNINNNPNEKQQQQQRRDSIVYIYYPSEFHLMEFLPLFVAFVIVFIYVNFSVRKIEMIRSRILLSISAVITILGSLIISWGLCFFFGLTISIQSKGVYPYLLILVGLENVLVLTKSVMSTDDTLDVKIRVAQGLSKEGWSISQTLLTEITILTIGLGTFVPVIQEFCIFAIVGLISDFFLQMLLFSTILGFNIKRVEYSVEVKNLPKILGDGVRRNNLKYPISSVNHTAMNRSRSHPKLSTLDSQQSVGGAGEFLATPTVTAVPILKEKKIPKRLRVVNFWARTRFFQKGFMIWMVVWIASIIYNSGLIERIFLMENTHNSTDMDHDSMDVKLLNNENLNNLNITNHLDGNIKIFHRTDVTDITKEPYLNLTEQLQKLKHYDYDTNNHLSTFHWSSILRQYNLSLSGKYVTILPTIKLSHVVTPENAKHLRNIDERTPQHFPWKALAVALDPIDFSDMDNYDMGMQNPGKMPLYPKSPMEIFFTIVLCIISVCVLAYTMVVLYRCICSRNYAEWRASWNDNETLLPKTERILEGVPVQLKGHTHRIECLVTDGNMVASSCLEGQIKVWDTTNGELLTSINRKDLFQCENKNKMNFSNKNSNNRENNINFNIKKNYDNNKENDYNNIKLISSLPSKQTDLINNITKYNNNNNIDKNINDNNIIFNNNNNNNTNKNIKIPNLINKINFNFSSRDFDPNKCNFKEQFNIYYKKNKCCNNINNNYCLIDQQQQEIQHQQQQQQAQQVNNPLYMHHSQFKDIINGYDDYNNTVNEIKLNDESLLLASPNYEENLIKNNDTEIITSSINVNNNNNNTDNAVCKQYYVASPIWCLDFLDNLIAIGCADGRLEFWEGSSGNLKCIFETETSNKNGVTHIKLEGDRVIAARLNGRIDFLRLESYNQGRQIDWGFTSAYRRTHVRTGSTGSLGFLQNHGNHQNGNNASIINNQEELRCLLECQLQGHQQPISCMDIVRGIVFTGSQDHTLKVFKLDSSSLCFTLHGHCGPITSLFLDQWQPGTGGSGSQDGLLCVWDLVTGACMYNIQAHDGSVISLACAPSYVISLGSDQRLCVWERFQGHLLNTINVTHAYSSLLMLTPSLLVTGKPGSLIVWDVRTGDTSREVKLDCANLQLCPKIMLPVFGSVICDYGNQLRLVRFPLVTTDKSE